MQHLEQLRQLRGRVSFPDWDAGHRRDVENLLRAMIDELLALGPGARDEAVMDKLRGAVEGLNQLDDGFIGTIEREDLCDALYKIGEAAGVSADEEWVDEYRDW
jgi:hypothetical protein